jgi:hypothetical protein
VISHKFPLSSSLTHRWRNGILIWPKHVTSVGRPIRPTNIDEISRIVAQLERANIIERCKRGTFLSYPFLRLKSNGAARLIIDYSHLTKKLNTPHYSAKSIIQLLHSKYWPRCLYYCKIDFRHAFYNLELKKDARFITTFKWAGQHYHFNRMPFGLSIAPFCMQMCCNAICRWLQTFTPYVWGHIDDLFIASPSELNLNRTMDLHLAKLDLCG